MCRSAHVLRLLSRAWSSQTVAHSATTRRALSRPEVWVTAKYAAAATAVGGDAGGAGGDGGGEGGGEGGGYAGGRNGGGGGGGGEGGGGEGGGGEGGGGEGGAAVAAQMHSSRDEQPARLLASRLNESSPVTWSTKHCDGYSCPRRMTVATAARSPTARAASSHSSQWTMTARPALRHPAPCGTTRKPRVPGGPGASGGSGGEGGEGGKGGVGGGGRGGGNAGGGGGEGGIAVIEQTQPCALEQSPVVDPA